MTDWIQALAQFMLTRDPVIILANQALARARATRRFESLLQPAQSDEVLKLQSEIRRLEEKLRLLQAA